MIKDHFGMTPLHRACVFGHVETVSLLIEKGSVIDDKNKIGWTPLYVFLRALRFLCFFLSPLKQPSVVRFTNFHFLAFCV
jgi:hypothetical protein